MSKFISYDLRNPGRKYDDLYVYLEKFSDYAKINESFWIVSSDKTSATIRDDLLKLLDVNDRVFVTDYSGTCAWNNSIDSNEKVRTVLKK